MYTPSMYTCIFVMTLYKYMHPFYTPCMDAPCFYPPWGGLCDGTEVETHMVLAHLDPLKYDIWQEYAANNRSKRRNIIPQRANIILQPPTTDCDVRVTRGPVFFNIGPAVVWYLDLKHRKS